MLVHQTSSTRALISRVAYRPSYQPAVLKNYPSKSHGWTIEYAVFNPNTKRMVRYSQKLNVVRKRFANFYDFRDYAMNIVHDINHRLSLGWSPIEYVPTSKADQLLVESYSQVSTNAVTSTLPVEKERTAIDTQTIYDADSVSVLVRAAMDNYYEKEKKSEEITLQPKKDRIVDITEKFITTKEKELRADTMRSYTSGCKALCTYLNEINQSSMYIQDFKKVDALRYMENLSTTKQMRNRTYNNYLKVSRAIFQWAVEQCYITENPFKTIKVKREEEKIRSLVDADSRKKIMDYLEQKGDIGFELVCHLVYTSLIRPLEISQIKIGNVNFERKSISLSGDITKTHYAREVVVSDAIIELMHRLNIDKLPKDYYLIGKDFVPSPTHSPKSSYQKHWSHIRKVLGLPKEMQLYSLKDTGITDMLEANIPAITVMKHADHHDLSITERYANHKDKNLIETIRSTAPNF